MRSFARARSSSRRAPPIAASKPVLLDRVEQRRRLQLVARGARAGLLDDAALVDRLLHARDDEPLAELGDAAVAVLDHLGEVVPGVDVHDRERELARAERLLGEPQQHDRVLAAREEQHGPLPLGGDLAHDVDRLGLELVEVRERRTASVVALMPRPRREQAELLELREHDAAPTPRACGPRCSRRSSGFDGTSYGSETPVNSAISPACALRVEPLRVAALALLERRRDVDLDEDGVLLGERARPLPRLLVGRDRRDDDGGAGAREPRGDPADAADVRVAVLLREAEILGQVLADDVAVEPVDDEAALARARSRRARRSSTCRRPRGP